MMKLPFDDELNPEDYSLHPQIRDQVARLEGYHPEYDPLLLRRQLWMQRLIVGKLREAGVPNSILDNLHVLGDIAADLYPHNTFNFGMDTEDPEFQAAMPKLPDNFILVLDYPNRLI